MKRIVILSGMAALFMATGAPEAMAQAAAEISVAKPDEIAWTVPYTRPEGVTTLELTLAYRFWDPKVDGDVASKTMLLHATVKLQPDQKAFPIAIYISRKESRIAIEGKGMEIRGATGTISPVDVYQVRAGQEYSGKGFHIDASFAKATAPKPDSDGSYVLAQKPVDAKHPAAMGDVQDASAWIELGISPQP